MTAIQALSTAEVAQVTGVKVRTLQYWARTELIIPSVQRGEGTGTAHRWSFQDVVAISVMEDLREAGVSTQALRKVSDRLREWGRSFSGAVLATDGEEVYIREGGRLTSILGRPGQRAWNFVLLDDREQELRQRVEEMVA